MKHCESTKTLQKKLEAHVTHRREECKTPQPPRPARRETLSPSKGHYEAVIRIQDTRTAKMKGLEGWRCVLFCHTCPSEQHTLYIMAFIIV